MHSRWAALSATAARRRGSRSRSRNCRDAESHDDRHIGSRGMLKAGSSVLSASTLFNTWRCPNTYGCSRGACSRDADCLGQLLQRFRTAHSVSLVLLVRTIVANSSNLHRPKAGAGEEKGCLEVNPCTSRRDPTDSWCPKCLTSSILVARSGCGRRKDSPQGHSS